MTGRDHVYKVRLPGRYRWTGDYTIAFELATGLSVEDVDEYPHPDEERITVMHKRGREYVLDLSTNDEVIENQEVCMNRTYDCGHAAFGPPRRLPGSCPQCQPVATDGGQTTTVPDEGDTSVGKYPQEAGVRLAARDGSERYYFRNPTGGISSVPAMDADQARKLVADTVRGFAPEDFEQVDGFEAEPWDYPDPVDADREVNEHDLWMLRGAMRKGSRVGLTGKHSPRKNPTEYTIEALLAEWDDAAAVPLHDAEALQQADGIGPHRAAQVVGAAVANRLIERPVRGEADGE